MENNIIQISLIDLKAVVCSIVANEKLDKITSKPQLTFKESCELYGDIRVRKYIKSGLLKPISQNGKGSKIYYSHKKIIDLTQKSFHHLNSLEL